MYNPACRFYTIKDVNFEAKEETKNIDFTIERVYNK